MDLVAVDSQIAVASRLISSLRSVTNCRLHLEKRLSSFFSHFRGFTADRLTHAGVSPSLQIGEVLARTLLNNASQSEDTLINAERQMISLAESRSIRKPHQSEKSTNLIPRPPIADVCENLNKMIDRLHLRLLKKNDHHMMKAELLYTTLKIAEVLVHLREALETPQQKEA